MSAHEVRRPARAAGSATPPVVPVRFGPLGNHRWGSGRFQVPELRRIPEQPLVSCLCVTENRHAFLPWLLWGFDRQTWKRRELVIVDSSDPPLTLPRRSDVRLIHLPPGTSLGKKRNVALDAARGEVVAWFDDDDWQHPKRLATLVPLLREYAEKIGASFIGPSKSFFLDVGGHRGARYEMHRYAIFNGSVYYTEMVRHARFPEDVLRTEDTRWISTLLRSRQGAALTNEQPTLFFWLSHAVNVTNANSIRRLPLDANELVRRLGSAWSDTPSQLAALRGRLATHPASRPLRVERAERAERSSRDPGEPLGPAAPVLNVAATRFEWVSAAPVAGAPIPVVPPPPPSDEVTRDFSLYLAGARDSAEGRRPGYIPFVTNHSPYGWLGALVPIFVRRKNEWAASSYVGVFDARATPFPEARALANAVARRGTERGICVLGALEKAPLGKLVGGWVNGIELVRLLFERLPIRDPQALERNVTSFGTGWLAPPGLFADYVRNWLIPALTVFDTRRNPRLAALLAAGAGSRRPLNSNAEGTLVKLLEILPSIAFTREALPVRSLGFA
ncbi:MAG TPA: glycosyltransferase family A protein [Polyangiaceae bacterium]|nr:glycosyltransferase family A protein [Polyangiaceae bacterium]